MWFFQEIEHNKTFELTSSDESSACSTSGASFHGSLPPPTNGPADDEGVESPPTNGPAEDEGVESPPTNGPAKDEGVETVLGKEKSAKELPSREHSVNELQPIERPQSIIFFSHLTRNNKFRENAAPEQERGAIEVEAAGLGFTSTALNDDTKDVITILSPESDIDGDNNIKPRRKRSYVLIGSVLILVVATLIGLVIGATRNVVSNKVDASPSSSSLTGNTGKIETGANRVDVDKNNSTNTTTNESQATQNPTDKGSSEATVEILPDGQEISCGPNHNIVVASSCQENSPLTTVLYCFATTRDGDWYWIRGKFSDNNVDVWDYTNGVQQDRLEFSNIPTGTYLVSLVRDSMKPYNVIITKELVVPNCTASA
jgi:hypothetical protein